MDFKVWGVCNALIMCWSFTALCLWWKESGKLICYLWRYEYKLFRDGCSEMIFKAKKNKKLCVYVLWDWENLQYLIDVTSTGGLSVSLPVFFFFLPYCQEKLPGEKETRRSFCGKWELVSNGCCYLCYVATSAFCQLQASLYVNNLNWAVEVSESARGRQHALPTAELFPRTKRSFPLQLK